MIRHALASAVASAVLLAAASTPAVSRAADAPNHTTSADCPSPQTDTRRFLRAPTVTVHAPRGVLALAVARDGASRERGLMCVIDVPHARGMIFAFAPPERVQGFWMKNTLIALDMVFVDAHGVVTSVAANVPATPRGMSDDAVARRSGMGIDVIELGAGDAARLGIAPGTTLSLPAIAGSAS